MNYLKRTDYLKIQGHTIPVQDDSVTQPWSFHPECLIVLMRGRYVFS